MRSSLLEPEYARSCSAHFFSLVAIGPAKRDAKPIATPRHSIREGRMISLGGLVKNQGRCASLVPALKFRKEVKR